MIQQNELATVQHSPPPDLWSQKLGFVVWQFLYASTVSFIICSLLLLAEAFLSASQLVLYCVSLIFYCCRQSHWEEKVGKSRHLYAGFLGWLLRIDQRRWLVWELMSSVQEVKLLTDFTLASSLINTMFHLLCEYKKPFLLFSPSANSREWNIK